MAWTFGAKRILSGDVAADGGMGTSLSEHDETLKGTLVLDTTEETINWISTEEKGKRLAMSQDDSETTLAFEVANPSPETQAYYLGGEVTTGTNSKKTYSPPKVKVPIYKSFKIETKEGYDISIPNGRIVATPLGGNIGTDSVLTMKVKIYAEVPRKEGVSFISYSQK